MLHECEDKEKMKFWNFLFSLSLSDMSWELHLLQLEI